MVAIRPERVVFRGVGSVGLPGQVRTRVFQGHEWLHRVDTTCGLVTVVSHNRGLPVPNEGDAVLLDWDAADMAITRDSGTV
jgi:hypothetical protein